MAQPAATPFDREIKKDGKVVFRLMKIFVIPNLPSGIDVDPDRPTIAAGNHQSLLDVFLAAAFCHTNDVSCRFLVQARYFDNRIAGRWLRRIGCIPLNGETKETAFAEARAALARGELVGIMPEGRLTKPEERDPQVGPGRPGVSELARETGALVRPITFHDSGLAWPRGKWPKLRFRRPVVTMKLGGPIDMSAPTDQENADRVMAALTEILNRLDAATDDERQSLYTRR